MSRKSNFIKTGNWYKGNTHAHTKLSDGHKNSLDLAEDYKKGGYSFLAITDHRRYGDYPELCTDDFLLIPGVELDVTRHDGDGTAKTICDHVVGLGIPGKNTFKNGQIFDYDRDKTTVEELIAFLRKNGNLAIYAHPTWSHFKHEDLPRIEGCIGMEIFNNLCQVHSFSGYAESYFERLMWNRQRLFCFASDDTHQFPSKEDYFGGFIVVKAKELSHEALFDAMMQGSFYASEGPEIYDFYVENGIAYLECSECSQIGFLDDIHFGYAAEIPKDGQALTGAQRELSGKETLIRAVCQDKFGKRAWTQPIWLDNRDD